MIMGPNWMYISNISDKNGILKMGLEMSDFSFSTSSFLKVKNIFLVSNSYIFNIRFISQ